ncbi:hypothetical protein D9757_011718 [Collybiopsis confluens]|uniref:Uncharacterized protein n=1 Tax=Collybiopsis confluens TaxID=2823264 RepID=A0A8H5GDU5_9AGAR|nr:hypothetical protein D9757_011718 [Collybiopsis confluens]
MENPGRRPPHFHRPVPRDHRATAPFWITKAQRTYSSDPTAWRENYTSTRDALQDFSFGNPPDLDTLLSAASRDQRWRIANLEGDETSSSSSDNSYETSSINSNDSNETQTGTGTEGSLNKVTPRASMVSLEILAAQQHDLVRSHPSQTDSNYFLRGGPVGAEHCHPYELEEDAEAETQSQLSGYSRSSEDASESDYKSQYSWPESYSSSYAGSGDIDISSSRYSSAGSSGPLPGSIPVPSSSDLDASSSADFSISSLRNDELVGSVQEEPAHLVEVEVDLRESSDKRLTSEEDGGLDSSSDSSERSSVLSTMTVPEDTFAQFSTTIHTETREHDSAQFSSALDPVPYSPSENSLVYDTLPQRIPISSSDGGIVDTRKKWAMRMAQTNEGRSDGWYEKDVGMPVGTQELWKNLLLGAFNISRENFYPHTHGKGKHGKVPEEKDSRVKSDIRAAADDGQATVVAKKPKYQNLVKPKDRLGIRVPATVKMGETGKLTQQRIIIRRFRDDICPFHYDLDKVVYNSHSKPSKSIPASADQITSTSVPRPLMGHPLSHRSFHLLFDGILILSTYIIPLSSFIDTPASLHSLLVGRKFHHKASPDRRSAASTDPVLERSTRNARRAMGQDQGGLDEIGPLSMKVQNKEGKKRTDISSSLVGEEGGDRNRPPGPNSQVQRDFGTEHSRDPEVDLLRSERNLVEIRLAPPAGSTLTNYAVDESQANYEHGQSKWLSNGLTTATQVLIPGSHTPNSASSAPSKILKRFFPGVPSSHLPSVPAQASDIPPTHLTNTGLSAPYVPPWLTFPTPDRSDRERHVLDELEHSFWSFGLSPFSAERNGSSGKKKSLNRKNILPNSKSISYPDDVLSCVPPSAYFMLLPLWPAETDIVSQRFSPFIGSAGPLDDRNYLLVFYVPLFSQSEVLTENTSSSSSNDLRNGFRAMARRVSYTQLQRSNIKVSERGISVRGPLEDAFAQMPRLIGSTGVKVLGTLYSRDMGFEFDPIVMTELDLCSMTGEEGEGMTREQLEVGRLANVTLTAVGSAVAEMVWIGGLALTSFGN